MDLAIRALARTFEERESINTQLQISPQLPVLPPDVEQTIYRITQETLANISKHANASQVWLKLESTASRIELTIKDDGAGFNPKEKLSNDRFGIKGMRERAAVVGGLLSVQSQPGAGTTVQFIWEIPDDQSADL